MLSALRQIITLALALAACGAASDPDTHIDHTYTAPSGPLCVPPTDPFVESECCLAENLRDVPTTVRTVIDFSDPLTITVGTCGTHLYTEPPYRRGHLLPSDPAAYPLKIVLPAITAADPACDAVCNEFEPFTMYGIAVDLDAGFFAADGGRQLSVLVPPPWKLVSGGCGEACPHPCLGGYQEYGAGRSCGTIDRGGFGFATGVTVDRPTEVLIELVAGVVNVGEQTCCLYP